MGSRTQDTIREAWGTTRIVALHPAVAVLLAALVVCLGYLPHGHRAPAAAPATSLSAAAGLTAVSVDHPAPKVTHPADCPSRDGCCGPVGAGVGAVRVATAHPFQATLPRRPDLPRQPDTAARAVEPSPACRAPDLHVLQVQRT
ncbi:hypothetical protein [Streptomyces cellulosae]|uniref:hypothetical protein n=1 Tax=Streptomyces cellulosae TaxID=1968 RepID=UPI00068D9C1E|nr:hypothetical protein [Streptomyces cellulosae]